MPAAELTTQEAQAAQAYVAALDEQFGPQIVHVLLFGSRARGEAEAGSDIDVAVILADADSQDLSAARGLAFDIWLSHQVFLSIRAMTRESWQAMADMQSLFYRNVLEDAVSLRQDATFQYRKHAILVRQLQTDS